MKQNICLITAIGSLAAPAVILSLKESGDFFVIGCNAYPESWTSASRYVDRFIQVPFAFSEKEFIQSLFDICTQFNVNYIIPLTDVEVDLLARERGHIEQTGARVCTSSTESLSLARNKFSIYEKFKNDPVVGTIPTFEAENVACFKDGEKWLAKPKTGRSSMGIVMMDDENSFYFFKESLKRKNYIFQPFIEGHVYVSDVVRSKKHGSVVSVNRIEHLRTSNGAGLTVEIVEDSTLDIMSSHIAEVLDLEGCVNMEFLKIKDKFCLMDINPRFSAGVAFTKKAGYDMVKSHMKAWSGEDIPGKGIIKKSTFAREYIEIESSDGACRAA